jgi:hypothetical protein
MSESVEDLKGPNGELGPVEHPETGEITHWGPHSTQIIQAGGMVVRIAHGEGFIPARDGAPAVIVRTRKD